eukprot:GHRR01005078.1.p1 GENE.GHRR01005078.1~~GHRR01005078.1.p1  ORF type:complete len:224 (+),score=60.25 GHRR01005078.1:412-1083(+)
MAPSWPALAHAYRPSFAPLAPSAPSPRTMSTRCDLTRTQSSSTLRSTTVAVMWHPKKRQCPLRRFKMLNCRRAVCTRALVLKLSTCKLQGGPVPEVTAAFLQSPDQAREAIQLAVRLYHQRATAPIPLSSMDRNAAPAAANSSAALAGTLRQRLQSLNQLVAREVLSKSEADGLKVAVLAAVNDPTARLGEAADLVDQGLITHAEFALLKANIVRQLKDDARP